MIHILVFFLYKINLAVRLFLIKNFKLVPKHGIEAVTYNKICKNIMEKFLSSSMSFMWSKISTKYRIQKLHHGIAEFSF